MSLWDSAVRFVTAKSLARTSHRDSVIRFITAKSWPEKATKFRQHDLLGPNVGQKEPSTLGSPICYGRELASKSHQDSAVRFATATSWEPPTLGSAISYGQSWARKSHQDSVVRFVTAKRGPERATKTRQYDLSLPRVGQKEPPRLGSTICCAQTWQKEPPRFSSTIYYGQTWARKSHQDSAVRFVTAKRGPERATETRQSDLLRPNVGQKEPPRLDSTICYGQTWVRKSHRDSSVRFVDLARKSHQDSAERFVTAKRGPERADLLQPRVGQKKPPRLGCTTSYGQTWARKSQQDSAVRFVMAKYEPEKPTKTRQYDLLRPNVGQKEPARFGSTICYGQELARRSHQDSAVRFVTAKSWPAKATKTRLNDLLWPN